MTDKLADLEKNMPFTRNFAAAFGYFQFAFVSCEEELDRSIWEVLKLRPSLGGYDITTSIRDMSPKIMLLRKLRRSLIPGEKNKSDCTAIVSALTWINNIRVDLIHGEIIAWDGSVEIALFQRPDADPKSETTHRAEAVSKDYLCDLTEYALTTAKALMKFQGNLNGMAQPLPSLDKRPQRPLPRPHKNQNPSKPRTPPQPSSE